ncbi:MAG: TonB-dependent receptor, partial [Phenylobacterium sp.]|nr:TonB-dependent receptor [Phenylobacterium sp.]
MRNTLLACVAAAPMLLATGANAQVMAASEAPAVSELIVTGEITFRNRTEDTAPALSYDLEYFQKFEPLTAGDAMKRVPSVQFLSD